MAAAKAKKKHILLRVLCIILATIILIVAILGITAACVWHNEFASAGSIKKLRVRNDDNEEGSVYSMKVSGGFYFDKFLAQGGASNDKQLIGFITSNITKGLIKMTIEETEIACSSFTATTSSGDKIFARNYDFAKTNTMLVICDNPGEGRYKSFSTVDLNYIGISPDEDVSGLMDKITCLAAPYAPLDGINEMGVSCGIYMSYQGEPVTATNQNDPAKDNITSTTMLRLVLDYAKDVEEAIELIRKYNLHDSASTSFHYMIADATGKSAVVEWLPASGVTDKTDTDGSARELVVHYNTGDDYLGEREANADFQWVTNFILQPDYYTDDEDKGGLDRYDYIYEQLSATNGVVADEQAAMDILAGVGRRTWNGGGGVTVHSAIYNLTQKSVLWVANENYNDKSAIFEYSFATGKITCLAD